VTAVRSSFATDPVDSRFCSFLRPTSEDNNSSFFRLCYSSFTEPEGDLVADSSIPSSYDAHMTLNSLPLP
jgi:hypothetical protein